MHGDFDMASDEAFEGIRAFLTQCHRAHEGHNSYQNAKIHPEESTQDDRKDSLPSRVVDITVNPPRIIAYVPSAVQEPYAAFSYVWGRGQDYILTSATIQTMMNSLDRDKIPVAIAEAIQVTRKLGINFFWIDALYVGAPSARLYC